MEAIFSFAGSQVGDGLPARFEFSMLHARIDKWPLATANGSVSA